jgi:Arc/MetJ-type ribon-helix-helix transcriptional regulator
MTPEENENQSVIVNRSFKTPVALMERVQRIIDTGKTEYMDASDFIRNAVRKEADFQERKLAGYKQIIEESERSR